MSIWQEMQAALDLAAAAPGLEEMPRLTLNDKGIGGPTSAHKIEELHTPLEMAYTTFTTGSTAMQNIVGVTYAELPARIAAGRKALQKLGLTKGSRLLVTYPPLVNVFCKEALEQEDVEWFFMQNSSRDALLVAMGLQQPHAVLGESSFLRAALQDAERMGLAEQLPQNIKLIAAGTPLDVDLPETAARTIHASMHDLYGCQEFGWLTLDGAPLREDILLLPDAEQKGYFELVVGGLPTGDSFPLGRHTCGEGGEILTYRRRRSAAGYETLLLATTAESLVTAERAARSILRLKSKIVRIAADAKVGQPATVLRLVPAGKTEGKEISGPVDTQLFDALLEAQKQYQAQKKSDAAWNKQR